MPGSGPYAPVSRMCTGGRQADGDPTEVAPWATPVTAARMLQQPELAAAKLSPVGRMREMTHE